MNPAEFVNSKGWKVGDLLLGHANKYERAKVVRITAVGEEKVLAVNLTAGFAPASEHSIVFDAREWERIQL